MIVFGERFSRGFAFVILQRHWHQLFLNFSGFVRVVRFLLRAQRELILHLARDAELRSQQLRGVRHV